MRAYSKFLAALLAFAGVVLSAGVLEGQAYKVAAAVVAGLGAALVLLVENKDTAPAELVEVAP